MGSSNYVTFAEFNNDSSSADIVSAPPPALPFGTGSHSSVELYEDQQPTRPNRYPIRHHITYPRNPYVQPPSPPPPRYFDNPYYSYAQPQQQQQLSPYAPTPPSPLMTPPTTPIHEALSLAEDGGEKPPPPPSNRWQGQTCVDINDHVVNCPICSQYYQNYSSMYIGIIILLGFIILIFLLKSIMEIRR